MEGFGEFLGSLFEGASEAASEAVFAAAVDGGMPGAGEGGRGEVYETYERYLCGGPRDLNINDL